MDGWKTIKLYTSKNPSEAFGNWLNRNSADPSKEFANENFYLLRRSVG